MPQNVTAAVLGGGEYFAPLIRAILKKEILPSKNIALSSKNAEALEAAEGYAACICEDEPSAVLKGEIVLACGSYKSLPLVLAPVSKVIGQSVLVTVSDDPKVNIDFVRERVVNGTEIITATLYKNDAGQLSINYDIAQGVRLYLHQTCRDLVNSLLF